MSVLGAWTQAVTVDGIPAKVRDCSITESSSQRVPRARLTLEAIAGNAAAFTAAVEGASVVVEQSSDGTTISNEFEIVRVTEVRGSNWTEKRAECRGIEYRSKSIRFQREWIRSAASVVVEQAWTDYGEGLGLSLDVGGNHQLIDVSSSFGSLYDLMEDVCRRTAWAWRIDSGTVRFFDPLAQSSPALSQNAQEIRGETLSVDRSIEQLCNIARTQGYIYRTERITVRIPLSPWTCRTAVYIGDRIPQGDEWEQAGDPVIIEDFAPDIDRTVTLNDDDWLVFDPLLDPLNQAPEGSLSGQSEAEFIVDVSHRRLSWFRLTDPDSITEFGPREGQPLAGDGGQTEAAAWQILIEHLARYAWPTISVDVEALKFGARPDTVLSLSLLDPSIAANLYVTEVTRTTRGSELTVALSLASPQTVLDQGGPVQRPNSADIDVVQEITRRVERLERRDAHPRSELGRTTAEFGSVTPTAPNLHGAGWSSLTEATFLEVTESGAAWSAVTESRQAGEDIDAGAGWSSVTEAEVVAQELGGALGQSTLNGLGLNDGEEQAPEIDGVDDADVVNESAINDAEING